MTLFEDPEFPASTSSILSHGFSPLSHLACRINWLRPQEISASPRLFTDDHHEGQVKQGILGDCWFLCACAALQENQQLLTKVLPLDQPVWTSCSYTGQFICRFWQFGMWVEVIIDDRLPCVGGKLCFSHCQSEEVFWLPLLEKAYAKLHGCYEDLWAGKVADALLDITGGIVERWTLGSTGSKAMVHEAGGVIMNVALTNLLEQKNKYFVCSVYRPYEGSSNLAEYHAFNVTEVKDVPGLNGVTVRLIRIWNPWGRPCWNGRWTEGGEGWTHIDPVYASELQANITDGEFWVDEGEFLKEFSEVTASYPVSEDGHIQSLLTGVHLSHVKQLSGSWVKGQSAGGCRNNSSFPINPKFWLQLWEHCEVLITVLQKPKQVLCDSTKLPESFPLVQHNSQDLLHYKHYSRNSYKAVGLHMWKVEKSKFSLVKILASPTIASTSCHAYQREVQLHCSLPAGYYLIVASTFLKDEEGDFLLRVLSSGTMSLDAMKITSSSLAWLDDHPQGEWNTSQLHGCWVSGLSSGGCRNFPSYHTNPRFVFSVCADVGSKNVKVTLHQQYKDHNFHAIGFHIYQFSGGKTENAHSVPVQYLEPVVSCIPHHYAQEVSQICTLPPGKYIIVPSTYQPNREGDFTLTIATKINRKSVHCEETLESILHEYMLQHHNCTYSSIKACRLPSSGDSSRSTTSTTISNSTSGSWSVTVASISPAIFSTTTTVSPAPYTGTVAPIVSNASEGDTFATRQQLIDVVVEMINRRLNAQIAKMENFLQ